MLTQQNEIKSVLLQFRVFPSMKADIKRICERERREEGDMLRIVISDWIQQQNEKAAKLPQMQEETK